MSTEQENIGVDVWIAGTIYVDALDDDEAKAVVTARYGGSLSNPFEIDMLDGEDIPFGFGGDFLSSAISVYCVCDDAVLVPTFDPVRDAAPEMLAVLKDALDYFEGGAGDPDVFPAEHAVLNAMRVVIAKAETQP